MFPWRFRLAMIGLAVAVGLGVTAVAVVALPNHRQRPAVVKPNLPPAQPEYARSFQGILDAAKPPDAKRIIVKDCRRGRVGNEHFCAWLGSDGLCRAGFIVESPSTGTTPVKVGRVPLPAGECFTANVLGWLKRQ